MKQVTTTLILTLLVLGGCAYTSNPSDIYVEDYRYKFKATAYEINKVPPRKFKAYSDLSQEDANKRATSICLLNIREQIGNDCLVAKNIEDYRQKKLELDVIKLVKQCFLYGFEGRVEIASCVQKEMLNSSSVVITTVEPNNEDVLSELRNIQIQNAITQGMLWFESTKPQTRP